MLNYIMKKLSEFFIYSFPIIFIIIITGMWLYNIMNTYMIEGMNSKLNPKDAAKQVAEAIKLKGEQIISSNPNPSILDVIGKIIIASNTAADKIQ